MLKIVNSYDNITDSDVIIEDNLIPFLSGASKIKRNPSEFKNKKINSYIELLPTT